VDTTETVEVAAETVADTAPVETVAEAAPAEDAPVETEAAAPADDSPFPWDGEMNSLRDAEWFSSLDDRVRNSVLNGLENKHRNWQRGWTKAYQENADHRKDIERRMEAVRQSEIRVQKWLHGDVDPLNEKQKEIDELKRVHEAAVTAIREEHQLRLSQINNRTDEEAEKVRQELLQHKEKLAGYLKADQEREQAQVAAREQALSQRAEKFQDWLKSNEPQIYNNDDAFESLCVMMSSGFSLQDSLTFLRAKYPAAAAAVAAAEPETKPEPEAVPESMSLMNMGSGSGTVSGESRSYNEIMDAMRRSAMQGGGGILGH
jgi:hypothetical protein